MSKLTEDPRIDPRIKAAFGHWPAMGGRDMVSREEVIERNHTEKANKAREAMEAFMAKVDNDEVAPSAGLTITTETFTSQPGRADFHTRQDLSKCHHTPPFVSIHPSSC